VHTGEARVPGHLGQGSVDQFFKLHLLVLDVEQRLTRAQASSPRLPIPTDSATSLTFSGFQRRRGSLGLAASWGAAARALLAEAILSEVANGSSGGRIAVVRVRGVDVARMVDNKGFRAG
jgi:hypothetical protein